MIAMQKTLIQYRNKNSENIYYIKKVIFKIRVFYCSIRT
jgi:hypothetical protein